MRMSQSQPGLHRCALFLPTSTIPIPCVCSHSLSVLTFWTRPVGTVVEPDSFRSRRSCLSAFFPLHALTFSPAPLPSTRELPSTTKRQKSLNPGPQWFLLIYLHGCHLSHCSVSIFKIKTLKYCNYFSNVAWFVSYVLLMHRDATSQKADSIAVLQNIRTRSSCIL